MSRALSFAPAAAALFLPALADSALKGVPILAIAGVAALAMTKASATARHLVWMCKIIGLLVLPVLSLAPPSWRVLPAWAAVRTADRASVSSPAVIPPSAAPATAAALPAKVSAATVSCTDSKSTPARQHSKLPDLPA